MDGKDDVNNNEGDDDDNEDAKWVIDDTHVDDFDFGVGRGGKSNSCKEKPVTSLYDGLFESFWRTCGGVHFSKLNDEKNLDWLRL